MWFALGAVGVAAVMLVGKKLYTTVAGRNSAMNSASRNAPASRYEYVR